MIVAQAVLVWSSYNAEELQDFIETGYMHDKSRPQAMPYNPKVLENMQRQLEQERQDGQI